MTNDELTLVSCAGCGIELLGERCEARIRDEDGTPGLLGRPGLIAMRVKGRPFCRECVPGKAATRPRSTGKSW
mgnify:CR=1 FL=1